MHEVDQTTEQMVRSDRLARETAELIKAEPHLELIREPDLEVVLFRLARTAP